MDISVNVGPDFFKADRSPTSPANANGDNAEVAEKEGSQSFHTPAEQIIEEPTNTTTTPPASEPMAVDEDEAGSPYDPLFDDADADGDAEAEAEVEAAMAAGPNGTKSKSKSPPPPSTGLALPGSTPSKPKLPDSSLAGDTPANNDTASSTPTPLFQQPAQAGPSRSGLSAGAARSIPLLTKTSYQTFSYDIMMASTMDGQVTLLDRRVPEGQGKGVGRLQGGEKTPPWCMSACWSGDGNQILAGRRNGTLDIWDVRRTSSSRAPNLLRTMKTPQESGFISCVVAFPDGRHIAT
jgi:transcriptional activator SPT8